MGWKDAERAYKFNLPFATKAVLIAITHATDDKTHQTYIGKKTIAERIGADPKTVQRALGVLVERRLIVREERVSETGYRTTDVITFTPEGWGLSAPEGEDFESSGQRVPETESPGGGDSLSSEGVHRVQAEEIIQKEINQKIIQIPPTDPRRTFEGFWEMWPRKVSKKAARAAWSKAASRLAPEIEVIYDAAAAYVNHPNRPVLQFVPHAATWLHGECWNDDLGTLPPRTAHGSPSKEDLLRSLHRPTLKSIKAKCAAEGHVNTINPLYCDRCGERVEESVA